MKGIPIEGPIIVVILEADVAVRLWKSNDCATNNHQEPHRMDCGRIEPRISARWHPYRLAIRNRPLSVLKRTASEADLLVPTPVRISTMPAHARCPRRETTCRPNCLSCLNITVRSETFGSSSRHVCFEATFPSVYIGAMNEWKPLPSGNKYGQLVGRQEPKFSLSAGRYWIWQGKRFRILAGGPATQVLALAFLPHRRSKIQRVTTHSPRKEVRL